MSIGDIFFWIGVVVGVLGVMVLLLLAIAIFIGYLSWMKEDEDDGI